MKTIIIITSILLCHTLCFAATSITQHGITWTLNGDYTTGQFITGDPWVLDPGTGVTFTNISNTRHAGLDLSTVDYDGTQIDSLRTSEITVQQGLISDFNDYSQSLNINHSLPYTVTGDKSVMSSIAWLEGDVDKPPGYAAQRPMLKRIAILTVTTSIPSATAFRPSYAVGRKTAYNASAVNVASLPSLTPASAVESISTYVGYTTGPWTDLTQNWNSEFLRPNDNYPYQYGKDGTYGMYVSIAYGSSMLAAMLDPAIVGDKSQLVYNLIQIGIDYYGLYLNGATWSADGGHRMGYKLPILFAGMMLNHPGMLAIGDATLGTFQEDNHWHITATDVATAHCGDYNGCPIPCGDRGLLITDVADRQYTTEMIGLPEWGIRHLGDTCSDDSRIAARYREANYWGLGSHALAAQILGIKALWKNNAFFDYHDRMFEYEGKGFLTTFAYNMWDTYRNDYPPVWQHRHSLGTTIFGTQGGSN